MKKPLQSGMSNKNDIKIFILFLLDNINYPVDYNTIHDISVQNGYVGNFDFAECFSELVELEHIFEGEVDGEKYYAISPKGHLVATELQSKIMAPIREKSLKSAMRLLSFQKRGASANCSYKAIDNGSYLVHFEITEKENTILDLDFSVASEEMAKVIKAKFDRSPEGMYRGMLSVLTGEMEYLLS